MPWKGIAPGYILLPILLLGGLGLMLSGLERSLVYFPVRENASTLKALADRAGLFPWLNQRGEGIGWRGQEAEGPSGKVIIVFHGNAGYALDRLYFVEGFSALRAGWKVRLFEYPGYGARGGKPSEGSLKAAAEEAVSLCLSQGERVALLGESLGTGVAAHLAGRFGGALEGICLVTPFTSLLEVARHHYPFLPVSLLMKERYEAQGPLALYPGPVAFLLAGQDEIVPVRLGKALYDGYPGKKALWVQEHRGHNTLEYAPEAPWWRQVSDFLSGAPDMPRGERPLVGTFFDEGR